MDASFSATPNGRAAPQDVAGNGSAIAQEVLPSERDQLLRGGRLTTTGLASRLRELAAIALLAFAAISPLRAEPYQGPEDTSQRAER